MQAMILAAGLGTRLLPHTLRRPKPLFPILNQPLLLLTIKRLQQAGCDHIVVNCHHLREQIVSALAGMPGVLVLEEETILGTGGGLRGALPYLRDEALLVTNGDIYHTVDFAEMYARHTAKEAKVTLAVHDYPRFNNVRIERETVTGFAQEPAVGCLAFTGLHVFDPAILHNVEPGQFSCILDCYRKMLASGQEIAAWRVGRVYWTDMGTPEDYLELHGGLLKGTIPRWPEFGEDGSHPFMISPGAHLTQDVRLSDWVCLGDVEIESRVMLTRVVAWDKVKIAADSRLSDALLSV